MTRYDNNPLPNQSAPKGDSGDRTHRFFSVEMSRSFNGSTWDAKHMTNFLFQSNYSNWRGDKKHISRISEDSPKRSESYRGEHFFRTTKDNRNESKIGYTPIFPLVSNAPVDAKKAVVLDEFLQTTRLPSNQQRLISGRQMKLRCSPDQHFKFQANAVKFQQTDPLTLRHADLVQNCASGFQKERMIRLISKRHPHGITGIDHPQNPQGKFYNTYHEEIRIREEPNSHQTFFIDRDWKEKKRSTPPVDEWKNKKHITVRKFRNENVHGYNILTNRKLAPE